MTTLHESISTGLDRASAFDYVADFAHQADWDPNTVASRRVDEGALGVGARFALDVRLGWRVAPMTYRITEFQPPDRVVLVGEGSGVWSEDVISFADAGSGTRVDYAATIRLRGLLGLLQPLLGRAFAKIARGAVTGMKRELDARAAASAGPGSPAEAGPGSPAGS